jgi:hypothetical protein
MRAAPRGDGAFPDAQPALITQIPAILSQLVGTRFRRSPNCLLPTPLRQLGRQSQHFADEVAPLPAVLLVLRSE